MTKVFKKKPILFLFLAFIILFLYVTVTEIYYDMFYEKVVLEIFKDYPLYVLNNTSFDLSSLFKIRISLIFALIAELWFLMFILINIFRRKPIYILTNEGITHYKYGFVSWKEVKKIQIIKTRIKHSTEYNLTITLKNPSQYFGKYKSLFGLRKLVISKSFHKTYKFEDFVSNTNITNLIEHS